MQARSGIFEFGPFKLQPERRLLVADGLPVRLASRAYDILVLLVQNRDRVVTREEIVAEVWRGLTVGDNNLTVQMSGLRQALAKHADPAGLIANIPGRGYHFVGEVVEAEARPDAGAATPGVPAQAPAAGAAKLGVGRSAWAFALALAGLVMIALGVSAMRESDTMTDKRLSILVEQFSGDVGNAVAADLARCYTEAVLSRFRVFEDLVLIPQHGGSPADVTAHYRLRGSVHLEKGEARIAVGVIAMPSNVEIGEGVVSEPIDASLTERSAAALDLLSQVRPLIFAVEQERRQGPARDAIDLYVEAQNENNKADTPQALRDVVAIATRAVAKDPGYRPAQVLLSFLLTKDMLWSSATTGDALGKEALQLIDGALLAQKKNPIYLNDRAYTLAALGRLEEARAAARRGLDIEPQFDRLRQILGEVMMQLGDLDQAKSYITDDEDDPTDDRQAFMAFAEGDYEGAIRQARFVIQRSPRSWELGFTMLLEAASLSLVGKTNDAHAALADALDLLPADLHAIRDQRQSFFILDDKAWVAFKTGLAMSGMAS